MRRTPHAPSSRRRSEATASWRESTATVGIPGNPLTSLATPGSCSRAMRLGETNTALTRFRRTVLRVSGSVFACTVANLPSAATSSLGRSVGSRSVATKVRAGPAMSSPTNKGRHDRASRSTLHQPSTALPAAGRLWPQALGRYLVIGVVECDGRGPPQRGLRKVRAPQGRLPGNTWAPRGDGQGHRKQTARFKRVRVKRWGKSPPRDWQQSWHGNPQSEQGQIDGEVRPGPLEPWVGRMRWRATAIPD